MSWYLFTPHPFTPLHFTPSNLAKMLIFICLKILILVHPLPPYLAPEPWPIWDADQIIFMCLNVLILFYPPPSFPTWSSVILWTLSKYNLEAITKSIFINLHFMVNGCPLQVRMHRFTDTPEVHLGDCFRPSNAPIFKTLSSFWKTTKFLHPYFNSISVMLDLS